MPIDICKLGSGLTDAYIASRGIEAIIETVVAGITGTSCLLTVSKSRRT
jgi:hypothetical protein